ncbi:hypothetical protein [Marinimicrobium sp. ABcell2]|uniref:hypothetical protein n=1 Tax=Marinimicrobium sp. ABcell2 TaxID=3069751 RepID=UPI0027AEB208|nr:hypothetical protein [Marinimicrobium sp. ABcell2]MDQ2077526.1 hypothetical protein [Marinimicrobium sp. ABcell2]
MNRNTLIALPFILLSPSIAVADGILNPGDTGCEELLETAANRATAARAVARQAADMIDAGESLEERSCFAGFREFEFDPFGRLPSNPFNAALDQLYERAKDRLMSAVCDASDMAMDSANKLLTCTAAVGVRFDANAGFDDINVEECAGLGLDMNVDGGSHNVGGRGTSVGTSTNTTRGVGGSGSLGGEEPDRGDNRNNRDWESWR